VLSKLHCFSQKLYSLVFDYLVAVMDHGTYFFLFFSVLLLCYYLRQEGYVFARVCLFVCLLAR